MRRACPSDDRIPPSDCPERPVCSATASNAMVPVAAQPSKMTFKTDLASSVVSRSTVARAFSVQANADRGFGACSNAADVEMSGRRTRRRRIWSTSSIVSSSASKRSTASTTGSPFHPKSNTASKYWLARVGRWPRGGEVRATRRRPGSRREAARPDSPPGLGPGPAHPGRRSSGVVPSSPGLWNTLP